MTINSDSDKFSQALRSALFWPLSVFFAATLLLLVFVLELLSEVTWSTHSYKVLADVRTCENLLLDAQNSVNGYLLTGDETDLASYHFGRDHATVELLELKNLVADNPVQTHNAQDIINGLQAWSQAADVMISQRNPQAPPSVDLLKLAATIFTQERQNFERFFVEEIKLRDQRLQRVRNMKTLIFITSTVLGALLVVTLVYQVRRQMTGLATSYREALRVIELRQEAILRSEKDLEAQKEWLRVTLTSIGDGVIVTDPAGRILIMNHESERLTGWTQSEALHHPLGDVFKIINEETRLGVENPVAKVLAEKKVIGLANHTVLISRHAEERPIEDSAAPILDHAGETLGVVLVFHDATATRRAEKSLKAYSAELERTVADRTLTLQQTVADLQAFSYTVSHDLRSPLRAMQGFSEALLEDHADQLDEQGRHYLERIKTAAVRLDRLIIDLLTYTRLARDTAPLDPLDLNRIVREVIEADAQLRPPAAQITVQGPLPKVMGRDTALTQVVTNLLGNAVKFVREGSVPQIRIWSEERGPLVRLWIGDNGMGIDPENQQKIFEMFVQLNDPIKFGGTGIGLAIVKKSMQIMRGSVGVDSSSGTGSRFWLELGKA